MKLSSQAIYLNAMFLFFIYFLAVQIDGTPQPYELLKLYSKKDSLNRIYHKLNKVQWERHLEDLKQLCILANQATEFEYNKNKTEGKTGVVKPDLISSKNIEVFFLLGS